MPNSVFGLPTHAFLVHGAVVLVPLASLALVLVGWRADWRRAYLAPATALAVVGAVFAFLAQQSGGPLKRAIRNAADRAGQRASFGSHPQDGNTAFAFAIALGVLAAGFWAIDRHGPARGLPKWAPAAAYAVVAVVAVGATVTMVLAGHSGATLVWKNVGTYAGSR